MTMQRFLLLASSLFYIVSDTLQVDHERRRIAHDAETVTQYITAQVDTSEKKDSVPNLLYIGCDTFIPGLLRYLKTDPGPG